jgi:ABC-2 type transport system permease protein
MNTQSTAVPDSPLDPQGIAPADMAATRPMYWSVRRELWENRSIYVAPLVVAAVALFGFAISTIGMPQRRRAVLLLGEAKARAAIAQPYDVVAVILIATAFIVGFFYCLDALHGERRDRSILFWKSLPVSDRTTVLSKASIPMVVLPVLIFAVIVTTQILMLLQSSAVLLVGGVDPATTFEYFNLFQQSLILLYGLIVIAIWHAPIYGWLLMVSSWARRAAVLWAVLPWLALGPLEVITTGRSKYFPALMRYRLFGGFEKAFAFASRAPAQARVHEHTPPIESLSQWTPGKFLSTPGLWIGLALAAAFLAAAVRLRRNREPI